MSEKNGNKMYIKEVSIWIKQEESRLASCKANVSHYNSQIRRLKQTIQLELKQMGIIQLGISEAVKNKADALTEEKHCKKTKGE